MEVYTEAVFRIVGYGGNMETGKAKYYLLMEELRERMLSGDIKAGDKLPSENELVQKYGVSRHTVRKAFAILENEGYVRAIHGKGTFCTEQTLHRVESKNIAVVTTYLSDYIFPRLIQGIDQVLSAHGYSIILKNTGNSRSREAQILEELLHKPIDGLIIEPSKSQILCKHLHLYQQLENYGIPYVFIQGHYPQMEDKPELLMDDCRGEYLLVKHLLERGRRRIAGIFKADDSQGEGRHRGYVTALQEAGIFYDPDLVIWYHTEDRKTKPSFALGRVLADHPDVDAVACYNDQIAVQVLEFLRDRKISVPKQIAVTGYDNSVRGADGLPGLTTVTHPQEELGKMAAELLLERIHGIPDEKSKVLRLIPPELILRQSTEDSVGEED